jgi:hypothetical protein
MKSQFGSCGPRSATRRRRWPASNPDSPRAASRTAARESSTAAPDKRGHAREPAADDRREQYLFVGDVPIQGFRYPGPHARRSRPSASRRCARRAARRRRQERVFGPHRLTPDGMAGGDQPGTWTAGRLPSHGLGGFRVDTAHGSGRSPTAAPMARSRRAPNSPASSGAARGGGAWSRTSA